MNILKKLKKEHICLFIVLGVIIVSYYLITKKYGLHGADDYNIYSYYFFPGTLIEKLTRIYLRITCWNMRIGDIICDFLGLFPHAFFRIFACALMLIFINLLIYISIGKVKNTKKYALFSGFIYLYLLTIPAVITEVLFWSAGMCNHFISILMSLIVIIPYVDYLRENKEIKRVNKKYIFYLLFCAFFAFNVETVVAVTTLSIFIVNFYYYIKNKKVNIYMLIPLLVICISFVIYILLQQTRILQPQNEWQLYTKSNIVSLFFKNRILEIVVLAISFIVEVIKKKKKILVNNMNLYFVIISLFSLITMVFSKYYVDRSVYIIDISILIYILGVINSLLKDNKKQLVEYISIAIISICTIIVSYIYIYTFIKYREFCNKRDEYIYSKIENDEEFVFYIFDYIDFNIIYNFYSRIIAASEGNSSQDIAIKSKYYYYDQYIIKEYSKEEDKPF